MAVCLLLLTGFLEYIFIIFSTLLTYRIIKNHRKLILFDTFLLSAIHQKLNLSCLQLKICDQMIQGIHEEQIDKQIFSNKTLPDLQIFSSISNNKYRKRILLSDSAESRMLHRYLLLTQMRSNSLGEFITFPPNFVTARNYSATVGQAVGSWQYLVVAGQSRRWTRTGWFISSTWWTSHGPGCGPWVTCNTCRYQIHIYKY